MSDRLKSAVISDLRKQERNRDMRRLPLTTHAWERTAALPHTCGTTLLVNNVNFLLMDKLHVNNF